MIKIKHFNVLLVDDEYFLRQSLKRHFENFGTTYHIAGEASNGEEALQILRKENIHILITDIRMPVMDGLELVQHVHELFPDVLTVILTGYADFEYAQQAIRYDVRDYLLKPVKPDDLENMLLRLQTELHRTYELPDDSELSAHGAKDYVDQAIAYIQQHYSEEIDMSRIAESMGFSSAYLTKLFNRYAGQSPLKYLTELRIRKAQELLKNTDYPISTVGEMVGYPDQFYFSKTFRKSTGQNPSAYRKQQMLP
ncbi:MAG: response regulator [Eubacteriales bacterium]|nr:response regulator [Eubacteriales bacterium]